MSDWRVLEGDCRAVLATLPAESVQTCVTSPPYWGLRDYGHEGQIGLERTPAEYVEKMVAVFREVRRVLQPDGTLWLNLGDCYASAPCGNPGDSSASGLTSPGRGKDATTRAGKRNTVVAGLKPKDLAGIPWRVAFALQADGWWLRSDIIWAKPNPMPESVTDRPTRAHEYLFLLTKAASYFYDAAAVREPALQPEGVPVRTGTFKHEVLGGVYANTPTSTLGTNQGNPYRNRRSVWNISTKPFSGAHFAVMPRDLVEPCILAGSRRGGTVLDPFAGSGTVGMVALRHGRSFVGIELNPKFAAMARCRIKSDAPLLNAPSPEAA